MPARRDRETCSRLFFLVRDHGELRTRHGPEILRPLLTFQVVTGKDTQNNSDKTGRFGVYAVDILLARDKSFLFVAVIDDVWHGAGRTRRAADITAQTAATAGV
jgi:hypothetical protein